MWLSAGCEAVTIARMGLQASYRSYYDAAAAVLYCNVHAIFKIFQLNSLQLVPHKHRANWCNIGGKPTCEFGNQIVQSWRINLSSEGSRRTILHHYLTDKLCDDKLCVNMWIVNENMNLPSVRKGQDELREKGRTRKKEVDILAQKSHVELSKCDDPNVTRTR